MTIIKQRAVTSKGHQTHLRDYINNDKKVLLRDSQNMESCHDLKRWAFHMSNTRAAFGHDKSTRRGKDGKPAKNTILYHQILGFLPDECDVNGGKLTPEDCMRYAREYAATYYPNQEIVFALHNEYCKADKTHRYAVHMVINRSDLATGKRLDEGRGETAKATRAKRVRTLDDKWNLKQVEREKVNSVVHKKQPSKTELMIAGRGGESYKTNLRELCRLAATKAENIWEYRDMLEKWGVETEFRKGRMYARDTDNRRYSFSVVKLDAALNESGLNKSFHDNVGTDIRSKGHVIVAERQANEQEKERIEGIKRAYLSSIKGDYLAYRKMAHDIEGTDVSVFPRFKLERPPKEVTDDFDVERTILAYWRGADELRMKMASSVPIARKPASGGGGSQGSQAHVAERGRSGMERDKGR